MKKLFVLTSVLALAAASTFAQGFVNPNSGKGYVKIQDTTGVIDGGVAVVVGTPSTTAGFTGNSSAAPGTVFEALYALPGTDSSATLLASTPLWTGTTSASTSANFQGTFNPSSAGSLQLASGTVGDTWTFLAYAATASGNYAGFSIASVVSGAASTPAGVWASTTGTMAPIVMVPTPEPATIALGGLGAAALLLFRRRK
jgi:hypothetical protein